MYRWLFCLLVLVCGSGAICAYGQGDSVTVREIFIECHHKTREQIIRRELALRAGSRIARAAIAETLERENNKLFNTDLFVSTDILYQENTPGQIDLIISLEEQWYLWAVPILEIADQNFNVWWTQRDRSLDRLEYGINFKQKNFRGRNENLTLHFQLGFTRKLVLDYQIPYISRRQRTGLGFNVTYTENTSAAYQTNDHFLDFIDTDEVIRRRFNFAVFASKRFNFYASHHFRWVYSYNFIADTLARANADYFLEGRTEQRYFGLSYEFVHDLRDRAPYPLKGHLFRGSVEQLGFGIFNDVNLLTLNAYLAFYHRLAPRIYLANGLATKVSLPERQPYFQRQGLGYRERFVRGYDLFVIDGQRYALSRNSIKWQAFSFVQNLKSVPIIRRFRQFRKVPLAGYVKIYADGGYVYDSDPREILRPASNRWLHSLGLGFDLVTYYNLVMRFEYSFANDPAAGGFFFNVRAGI
ncbi:MAG: BamA/TamA family outer membrane protein [Bernardetiaceae bacterium]